MKPEGRDTTDPWVFAYWVSVSGSGVSWLDFKICCMTEMSVMILLKASWTLYHITVVVGAVLPDGVHE
jgi:hypothetical protein